MVGDGFVDALVAWSIDKLTKLTDWFCFVRITTATQNTAKSSHIQFTNLSVNLLQMDADMFFILTLTIFHSLPATNIT